MTGTALTLAILRRAFYTAVGALVLLTVVIAILGLAVTIRP